MQRGYLTIHWLVTVHSVNYRSRGRPGAIPTPIPESESFVVSFGGVGIVVIGIGIVVIGIGVG